MEFNYFLSPGESVSLNLDIQEGALVLKKIDGFNLSYVKNDYWTEFVLDTPVDGPLPYDGVILIEALEAGHHSATLVHVDEDGNELESNDFTVDVYRMSIRNDSDRDGDVDETGTSADNWVWGDNQRGAVVLVNNDKEINEIDPSGGHYSEWSKLIVDDTSLDEFPDGVSFTLNTTQNDASRLTVYTESGDNTYQRILGVDTSTGGEILLTSPQLSAKGQTLYLEAHDYPNAHFEGLITLDLVLSQDDSVLKTQTVVYRVAPWIMTPNTLPAERVFACKMAEGDYNNENFLANLTQALDQLKVPLNIIEPEDNLGDRWIQDEIEFGYVQSPTHILPVVMDSPRDRGLDGFPEKKLLGEDFGHFQIGGSTPNSLDSFGNLEVSPPVTVNGKNYPFGRIVFGGKKYGDYSDSDRQMMPQLRKFLFSQKVQSPIKIYTDWLIVGHADEIISFVPADNDIGFQMLVASPENARMLLESLSADSHGDTVMFEGMMRNKRNSGESAEITVDELLDDESFWQDNETYQQHMDVNISILKRELGLFDKHIIAIPVLFQANGTGRTAAYFPDMVNHLVIGNASLVPKPHGPIVDGECAFEKAFKDALPEREVVFIEDWYSYHELLGEVHCGTNVQRKPFDNQTWWSYKPEGGYDI